MGLASSNQAGRRPDRNAGLRSLEADSSVALEIITVEAAYFEKNAAADALPEFRRQHLFVGSGVIIGRHAHDRRQSHVSPNAGTLQPRTNGREAHSSGKTGKRSDGWALGNEPARVGESELRPYVTIHVTTNPSNSSL